MTTATRSAAPDDTATSARLPRPAQILPTAPHAAAFPQPRGARGLAGWFTDRGVRTKILAVIGVLAAVAIMASVIAVNALAGAGAELQALADNKAQVSDTLSQMRAKTMVLRAYVLRAGVISDAATERQIAAQIDATDTEIDGDITRLDPYMMTSRPEQWQTFKNDWAAFNTLRADTLMPLATKQDPSFPAVYEKQGVPASEAVETSLAEVEKVGTVGFEKNAETSIAETSDAIRTVIIAVAAGLAAAIALGLYVAGGIRRALVKVESTLTAMARKDLTVEAGVESADEIGRMARALTAAQANMRAVIASVAASAQSVASSAEELSASSVQIAASAEETAGQAGVVASASGQVSRSVQTVAAGAEEMGSAIREIANNAAQAAKVAAEALTAADGTTSTVHQLGASSKEIGEVIKTITSIAAQTNLLALNATIEAARAGEAGKGFAVVANEVKELAQGSSKAADDIVARIEAIQADSTSAAAAIEQIGTIIRSINDYQSGIASAVEQQTATTGEMARNVTEAATGVDEIAGNISGVATAADSTSEALQQTRTAVDQLAALAAELNVEVADFSV